MLLNLSLLMLCQPDCPPLSASIKDWSNRAIQQISHESLSYNYIMLRATPLFPPHHIHDGEDVGGDVVPAVLLQHLPVCHHQGLHIQSPHPVGINGRSLCPPLPVRHRRHKLVRHDERVLGGRLGSI